MHDSEEMTSGFKGRLPIVEDDCTPKGTCAKFHHPMPKKVRSLQESFVKIPHHASEFVSFSICPHIFSKKPR